MTDRNLSMTVFLDGRPIFTAGAGVTVDEAPINVSAPEPTGDEEQDKKAAARHAARVKKLEAQAAERNLNRAVHLILQCAVWLLRAADADLSAADAADPADPLLKDLRGNL